MKIQYVFLLFVVLSCQKQQHKNEVSVSTSKNKKETTLAKENFLKTDTVQISEEDENSGSNFILAHLLDQKADKDSIVTAKYQLDFYQNKNKIASSKVTIENCQKGSDWMASYGLTSENDKNSPFIKLDFGYPACGYTHENYLYYLKNNTLQLVYQWDAMSDSGWGSWVEFTNTNAKSNPDSFYCKRVALEPEDDNEDMAIVKYSDSIGFELKNDRWTNKLLSAKEKPYFEKKVLFNEFYKEK